MMKYRHIKTGAVIESNSEITGKNWELSPAPSKPVQAAKRTATKKGAMKK